MPHGVCVCVVFFFKGEEKGLNPLSPAICLLPKVPDQRGEKKKKKKINPSSAETPAPAQESALI